MKSNIVIIGMPGAGKTTIGGLLAKRLGYYFMDTDELIEKQQGKKRKELFLIGEDYFREIEKNIIKDISLEEKTVISTGGGVIKNPENINELRKNGIIIFLDRPKVLILRDINYKGRALLTGKTDVDRLYSERYDLYKKYSNLRVNNTTTIESVLNIMEKIIEEYRKKCISFAGN